uniref:Uncharacterized protein n=1 Tax=Arundo donax TaxID=35708 RepID=A0A0A9HQA2_ARUDO
MTKLLMALIAYFLLQCTLPLDLVIELSLEFLSLVTTRIIYFLNNFFISISVFSMGNANQLLITRWS